MSGTHTITYESFKRRFTGILWEKEKRLPEDLDQSCLSWTNQQLIEELKGHPPDGIVSVVLGDRQFTLFDVDSAESDVEGESSVDLCLMDIDYAEFQDAIEKDIAEQEEE
jgi:hypothetical protein